MYKYGESLREDWKDNKAAAVLGYTSKDSVHIYWVCGAAVGLGSYSCIPSGWMALW